MTRRAELDVVVLGATGVTGREVVRHLAARAPAVDVTWAVAGRDADRCREVLAVAGVPDVPVLEVDVTDRASVERVVARAAVVANLVGPYARFGRHVYDVCATTGTDEVDVCGELDWLARQIDVLHPVAARSGSRIVTACGFESLPFDVATLAVARAGWSRWREPLAGVEVAISVTPAPAVTRLADVVSSGTVRSGTDAIRRGATAATSDVRLLDPRPHAPRPLDLRPWRHPIGDRWLGPLLPTPYINPAIVHRTAGLSSAAEPWFDEELAYRDGLVSERLLPGIGGVWTSAWLSGLQVMSTALGRGPAIVNELVADAIEAFGPTPGEGPSPEHLAGWRWQLELVGTTVGGRRVEADVSGSGHPGYRSTAALAAEAACCLATADAAVPGGVLTPAVAFADVPLERWDCAGCTFAVR